MSEAKQQLHPGTRNVMNDIVDKLHRVIAEKKAFQDHAVEVLTQVIWNDYGYYRCTLEESKVKARELLGIKGGENGRI